MNDPAGPTYDLSRLTPGSFEWDEARERAREAAHATPDPAARAAALDKVRRDFGPKPTSRTLARYER